MKTKYDNDKNIDNKTFLDNLYKTTDNMCAHARKKVSTNIFDLVALNIHNKTYNEIREITSNFRNLFENENQR